MIPYFRSLLFVMMVLLHAPCFSQQKDSVFLYNGQILIGDIKEIELGVITIDDIDIKIINVKLYKIKLVKSAQSFRIETNKRLIYYGSLGPSPKSGWTDIMLKDGNKIALPLTDISNMIFLEKNFFKRLDGNVTAGFSFTKSSHIGQINVSAEITYATKSLENQLSVSMIGSIDSSRYSRDNENVELFSNYNINSSWFIAGLAAYQRNLELSISRRFQQMIGAGNKLILKKNAQLLLISGLTFNQERSTDAVSSGLLLEIPLMLRFDFYRFRHPDIQISTAQTTYFSLSQKGRIRYNGSTNFSWQLVHNFYLTFNLYSNYDNQPPTSSSNKVDYGIVIGVSFKF